MNKKSKWIVIAIISISVIGFMIWQIYSSISSKDNIIISDQVETTETMTITSPGEPLKNTSKDLKKELVNLTD